MVRRLDQLGECNNQQVPYEDFKLQFCDRCVQPECTRSQHGTSKFDQRVMTWEKRLFSEVPRMDPSDPRFSQIQGKQFKMFDPGPLPTVRGQSAWMDPRDLVEPAVSVPIPIMSLPVEEAPPPIEMVPESPPKPQPQAHVSTEDPQKKEPVRLTPQLLALNTPSQSGRMLSGSSPTPPKDPWAGPKGAEAPEEGVVVVKRGATVRFGGNGVE